MISLPKPKLITKKKCTGNNFKNHDNTGLKERFFGCKFSINN